MNQAKNKGKKKMNVKAGSANMSRRAAPVAKGFTTSAAPRVVRESADRAFVANSEYVVGLYGATGFQVREHGVNAGLKTTQTGLFSWLNELGRRYEHYRFTKLHIRYEPACATTATGQVGMYLDYGVLDPKPASWENANVNQGFVGGSPWMSHVLKLEPKRVSPSKKLTRYDLTTGDDLQLADAARLYLCVNGQVDGALVGYIYVDYEVELYTPEMSGLNSAAIPRASTSEYRPATPLTLTSTVERAINFANTPVAQEIAKIASAAYHNDYVDITGTSGRIKLSRGLWRMRVIAFLKNASDLTTSLALAVKTYVSTTGSHTEVEAALDQTGSGAHNTLETYRASIHSTATPSTGDIPTIGEWFVYSDGFTWYGVYATAVFAPSTTTIETNTRLFVAPAN
jgi:hypothetical protein